MGGSTKKRQLIIGDVHGCYDELCSLLKKLEFKSQEDDLIFVGDLIHKGPRSFEVLELVDKFKPIVVLGNHERFFIQTEDAKKSPTQNLRELKDQLGPAETKRWYEWMKVLPTYYEADDFMVVHAGLEPGKHPRDSGASLLTSIRTWDGKGKDLNNPERDKAWYDFYEDDKLVIYGHWARQGLTIRGNTLGLDTGCLYGGLLTAVVMPERKIVQVPALKQYVVPGAPYR